MGLWRWGCKKCDREDSIKTRAVVKRGCYKKSFEASSDLANLTRAVGADVYLSGPGGRGYLNLEPFNEEGIEVRFQKFHHPEYTQRFPGFAPNMAAIDALFNAGNIFSKESYTKESPAMEIVS